MVSVQFRMKLNVIGLITSLLIVSEPSFGFSRVRSWSGGVKKTTRSIGREIRNRPRNVTDSQFEKIASDFHYPLNDNRNDCDKSITELTNREEERKPSDIPSSFEADWACNKLKTHLNSDTKERCVPPLAHVFREVQQPFRNLTGDIHYFPFVFLPYRYRLGTHSDQTQQIQIRVAFNGSLIKEPIIRNEVLEKFSLAEKHWELHVPADLKMDFQFLLVEKTENPHFVIAFYDRGESGRKRYNQGFKISYSYLTMAHEFGHMMGLNDEYDQLHVSLDLGDTPMEKYRCDYRSIMCTSREVRNVPLPYHYYLILRRSYCAS